MKIQARVEIVNVSPEMARSWLNDLWPDQRLVRSSRVEQYTEDMNEGRFRLSSDAILRIRGKLANGQHRLQAVIESGTTQPFIVMHSDDDQLYKIIDAGLRRTAADALKTLECSTLLPAIARWMIAYDNGSRGISNSFLGKASSQAEIVKYCEENATMLVKAAKFVRPLYSTSSILAQSIGGAMHVIGSRVDNSSERVEQFLREVYIDGGNSVAQDLRNRLIGNKGSKAKIPVSYIFCLTIKAFSHYARNERPKVLRVDPNALPKIYV